jgi:NHL repeat
MMRAAHGWVLVALCAFASGLFAMTSPALAVKEYVPGGSFGEPGSAAGQLEAPKGVAVNDATGDVYVVDTGNARIDQFDSTGKIFIRAWGWGIADGLSKELQTCTLTCFKGFTGSGAGEFQTPDEVAVANSQGPSAGDVYVSDPGNDRIDQFTATGVFVGQLTGTCEKLGEAAPCAGSKLISFHEAHGVAVDPSGNLWVYDNGEPGEAHVDEFNAAGAVLKTFRTEIRATGLAVDSADNVYAASLRETAVLKYASATGALLTEFGKEPVTAVAINPTTDDALVDGESRISVFGPFGEPYTAPSQTFPDEGLSESHGIAVNGISEIIYATQRGADNVEVFDDVPFPTVTTEGSSAVAETSATLEGSVNPEGEEITVCEFEYGPVAAEPGEYPTKVACSPEAPFSGREPVNVSASVTGLEPRHTYHFRLTAVNAHGTRSGKDQSVFTVSKPLVEGESASDVGSEDATVSATIDASGLPTSYRVEYGTSEEFGSSAPMVNIGAPRSAVSVQAPLSGLQTGAKYYFRFVATNALGTVGGSTVTFSTSQSVALTAQTLPDNRAYELVSAPDDTEVHPPSYGEPSLTAGEFFGIPDTYRAAASGDAVAYLGDPPTSGVTGSGATGAGEGNQYLATRTAKGWAASDLEVAGGGEAGIPEWRPLAADLSVLTVATNIPITAEPQAPAGCLYSRTTSGFHSLVASQKPGQCEGQSGGVSADDSHILLYSHYAYTPLAVEGAEFHTDNLYDSVAGQLHQVNVLPDGEPEPHPDATFGTGEASGEGNNFGGDISADGSRVFWKDQNTEVTPEDPAGTTRLFVRENDAQPQSPLGPKGECAVVGDACTVQMDAAQGGSGTSGGGVFRASSSNGSRAFFTAESQLTAGSTAGAGEPDLYEYDVNTGVLTDLTLAKAGAHANVQGVVGASEDGSYVYFVADGVLTEGANGEGKEPVSGQPNLYMSHNGVTTFTATLSSNDNDILPSSGPSGGDWQGDVGARTAEVAPGGRAVTFMSTVSLTGYDNYGVVGHEEEGFGAPIFGYQPEVFVYEAGAGRIFCASCNPGGAPPALAGENWENKYGGYVGQSDGQHSEDQHWSSFQLRFINEAGTQVFFMTAQPLVPQDTNKRQDVYEWESDGSGGCRQTGGCVSLLSSGSSPNPAFFVDASVSGQDVFFTSRAQLVPGAVDEAVKLYDARVNGGFSEPSLACTGTGCQGVPPAPPIFATPSSVTFNGVGNFEASASGKVVTPRLRTAAQVRAERLARALKACKKRAKKKRAVCEKTAKRRYAPAKKKGKR